MRVASRTRAVLAASLLACCAAMQQSGVARRAARGPLRSDASYRTAPFSGSSARRRTVVAAVPPQLVDLVKAVPPRLGVAFGVNTALAAVGVLTKQKSLTPAGLAHAWALGVILLGSSLGWRAYATCVVYLVFGSAVTKVKQAQKEKEGIAEGRGGRRGPENVWGSAATAAIVAIAATRGLAPEPQLAVAFVASLATKLSDTVQSEIGKAYGKTTYLITTLKRVPRGTEGAVSLEGTVAGFGGSAGIAAFACLIGFVPWSAMGLCVLAAFVGTTFESYLGALLQGRLKFLTNEVVNFLNTLVGAATAYALYPILLAA